VGIGFAVGLSMVSMALSLFILLRGPGRTLQRDLKATVRRLEAEWDDAYERLTAASGRYAKQRGLLEAARGKKSPSTETKSNHSLPMPGPITRSDLFKLMRAKEQQNATNVQQSKTPTASGGS
jgi:hypothetical protein